jgi:hypothetical protein
MRKDEFLERLLCRAAREVQLLATLTPVDAQLERARLIEAIRTRRPARPRWSYAPAGHDDLRRALAAAERELERNAETPLDGIHLGRLRELLVEAALCEAAGTSRVAALAVERFRRPPPEIGRAAADLVARWLADFAPASEATDSLVVSDADEPRSLLTRMRSAVGRLRLPFSVVPRAGLLPLAATGDNVILVAAGRRLREEDAERTVLHEIEGHALPRVRAASAPLAIFRAGTARGIDDQEGRALLLEERAGFLGPRRRRQLAARHFCVEAMLQGATFEDAVRAMVDLHGVDPTDGVLVGERVFRGGDGVRAGLGRERVYLESLVRVGEHLERRPQDEDVMASGQIAVDAIDTLRGFVGVGG